MNGMNRTTVWCWLKTWWPLILFVLGTVGAVYGKAWLTGQEVQVHAEQIKTTRERVRVLDTRSTENAKGVARSESAAKQVPRMWGKLQGVDRRLTRMEVRQEQQTESLKRVESSVEKVLEAVHRRNTGGGSD